MKCVVAIAIGEVVGIGKLNIGLRFRLVVRALVILDRSWPPPPDWLVLYCVLGWFGTNFVDALCWNDVFVLELWLLLLLLLLQLQFPPPFPPVFPFAFTQLPYAITALVAFTTVFGNWSVPSANWFPRSSTSFPDFSDPLL